MKIIGLAGTLASGKDVVAELLAEKHGFLHVSTGDMLRAEKKHVFGNSPEALLKRNDPFANKLRETRGPGVLVELAYKEYQHSKDKFPGGLVASGIRSIGEAEKIKELGGTLIFVDADRKIRYERAFARKRDVNDSSATFDEFVAMERSESPKDNEDKSIINLLALNKIADIHLENNGNDISGFEEYVQDRLHELLTGK